MHSILTFKHQVLGIAGMLAVAGIFGHMYSLGYIVTCFEITMPTFAAGFILATVSKALEPIKEKEF